jgi:hypothetical protein
MSFKKIFYLSIFSIFDAFISYYYIFQDELKVVSGPFAGMNYLRKSVGSSFLPKIFGTYEMELHAALDKLPVFDTGYDIGAAEGYYAIGMLTSGRCKKMVAWEMESSGRQLLKELAARNGMSQQVRIEGECNPDILVECIKENEGTSLIIVDCEGYERHLIPRIPQNLLSRSYIMIETHEPMSPGVHLELKTLLEKTHEITEVWPRKRIHADLPAEVDKIWGLLDIPIFTRLALSERRCRDLAWLVCTPKVTLPRA